MVGYMLWQTTKEDQLNNPQTAAETEQTERADSDQEKKDNNNEKQKEQPKEKKKLPISDKPNPVKQIKDGLPTYAYAPPLKIDTTKDYKALMKTDKGDIEIELYANDAPNTVNNFIFLAKDGYYNGVTFHRIIKDFMIQSGDPKGNGTGGPGYKFADELGLEHSYEEGTIAMANAGSNTNGSQFFIVSGPQHEFLNETRAYSIFGKVKKGMDVVKSIAATPVKMGSDPQPSVPLEKVEIKSIEIQESK
jgi:cyclophilin family peptidyl-prolyl cis-trans isomerase